MPQQVVWKAGWVLMSAATLVMGTPVGGQAQQVGQVPGTVTSAATGAPVVAVQLSVVGTTLGTLSGSDGSFTITNVPVGTYTVLAQRLGFQEVRQTVAVAAGSATTMNVVMQPAVLALEGIVATGLVDPVEGVRSPITVGRVDTETMPIRVAGSAVANLQGKMAGVMILRRSGQPGEDIEMQLRSQTSIDRAGNPLIVVDGVILGSGSTNIESLDIASIEVVKGASAASLYGSRAAAGVISITTNRGQGLVMGETSFNARSEMGISTRLPPQRRPTHHHYLVDDPMNPTTYVDVNGNPVDRNARVAPPPNVAFMDKPYFVPIYDNLKSGAVYRPGNFQTHSFTVSQNSADLNYAVTLNKYAERGALVNNDGYERNSFRVNLDHRFLNTMSLGMSAYHSRDTRDEISGLSFTDLLTFPPEIDLTRKDENGEYLRVPDPQIEAINPLWTMANRESERNRARTLGSLSVRWEPRVWLSLMSSASYDREDSKTRTWIPKGIPIGFEDDQDTGSIALSSSISDTFNAEAQVQLHRDFGLLNARLTLRGLLERSRNEAMAASGENFFVEGVPSISATPQANRSGSSSEEEIRALGYLADLSLSYSDKYIASLLVRRDGSSLFGPQSRWHAYYRTAFAWRLGEEDWFNVPNVGEFKVSYARGTAGGRPQFADQFESWSVGASGITKGALGNKALKPEHTLEQEIAVEAIVFGRVGLDFTHAWQRTTDQLFSETLPSYTGYTSQWTNGGTLVGHTSELTVEAQLITTPSFMWQSTIVADRTRGKLEEWPFACTVPSSQMRCAGVRTFTLWGALQATNHRELDTPHSWPPHTPDDCHHGCAAAEYLDEFMVNDDGLLVWVGEGNHYTEGFSKNLWGTSTFIGGKQYDWGMPFLISTADGSAVRTLDGDANHVGAGWINNFSFGALSLHVALHSKIGGVGDGKNQQNLITSNANPHQDQSGKPDELKKPMQYYTLLQNSGGASIYFIEPSSFLKVRTVSANYRFSQSQLASLGLGGMGVTSVQLGLIGRDLFTITQFTGEDPENALRVTGPSTGSNAYPPTRTFTGEISVSF